MVISIVQEVDFNKLVDNIWFKFRLFWEIIDEGGCEYSVFGV